MLSSGEAPALISLETGGGGWIRTSVRQRRADLQSAAFNHSATPPRDRAAPWAGSRRAMWRRALAESTRLRGCRPARLVASRALQLFGMPRHLGVGAGEATRPSATTAHRAGLINLEAQRPRSSATNANFAHSASCVRQLSALCGRSGRDCHLPKGSFTPARRCATVTVITQNCSSSAWLEKLISPTSRERQASSIPRPAPSSPFPSC
jgi:hypothetical protein